jgi:uncharacterized OB-fold protein
MQRVLDAFPDVLIDHDNRFFYEGLLDRRLVLNRCGDCGTWHAEPLRAVCDRCLSWNVEHVPVSGGGTVYMLTRLHQGPPVAGVRYDPPLPLAVITLDAQADLRVSGLLLGPGAGFASIGQRVRLVWPDGQVAPRLAFQLADPS